MEAPVTIVACHGQGDPAVHVAGFSVFAGPIMS
jgi:hypothetical protein